MTLPLPSSSKEERNIMSDEKYYKITKELNLPAEMELAFLEYIEQETNEEKKRQTAKKFLNFARARNDEENFFSTVMAGIKNKHAQDKQEAKKEFLSHIKLLEAELSELDNDSYIAKLRHSIENI